MKFWKHSILSAVVFMSIASTVTYTSCIHDSCKAIICRNGGVCNDEFCLCPDGYEGTQCETKSRLKFQGTYMGQTKVNNLPVIRDSAAVSASNIEAHTTSVMIRIASRSPEVIEGVAIKDEVFVDKQGDKTVTFKMIGEGKIEVLIDETVDGKKVITNFSGTKVY